MRPVTSPHCLIPSNNYEAIYLCVFGDASLRAYAAVAYIVCEYPDHSTAAIALGKVRVTPKQTRVTMTRLELMAAVAAIDVAVTVQAELKVDFTAVHFWTDSTCILQWVRNPD